jgi:hypothetical protein
MDPQIRIRIHTKMSYIRNTDFNPKTVSQLSEIWSGFFIHPGSWGQQGTGSRNRNTECKRGELPEGAVACAAGDTGVGRGEAAHRAQLTRRLNRLRHLKNVSIQQCCGSGSACIRTDFGPDPGCECRKARKRPTKKEKK